MSNQINDAKINIAKIEGRMQSSQEQLKKLGLNNVDEAEEVLNKKKQDKMNLVELINSDYDKLKEEWGGK